MDKVLAPQLRRCARFYPHHGNTGGFFVAMIRKVAPATSIPLPISDKSCLRDHPLLVSQFKRVEAGDAAWIELSGFFHVDRTWSEDKLRRGLLFWKSVNGKQPECLTLASEGMARLWDAPVATGKPLAWVRLGEAVFELLPKGFLTGSIAPTRWRAASEGTATVMQVTKRRRLSLPPATMLAVLRSENRQALFSTLSGAMLDGQALGGESRYECGGVLVSVQGLDFNCCHSPGALTPRLLRLLVDKDVAEALEDLLVEHIGCLPKQSPRPLQDSWCFSMTRMAAVVRSICCLSEDAKDFAACHR